MKVQVLFFASYREKAGLGRLTLDMHNGATVGDLADTVRVKYPELPEPERIVVAVNNEYQDHDFVLGDGDEAALIPPVSGG